MDGRRGCVVWGGRRGAMHVGGCSSTYGRGREGEREGWDVRVI